MNMKIQNHYFLIFMYVSFYIILKLKYDLYPITYNRNFLTITFSLRYDACAARDMTVLFIKPYIIFYAYEV